MKHYKNKNNESSSIDHTCMSNFFPLYYCRYDGSIIKYHDLGTTKYIIKYDNILEGFLRRALSKW